MSAIDVFNSIPRLKVEDVFTTYEATIQVQDILTGGIPKGAGVIKAWLAARLEADDQELEELSRDITARMKEEGLQPSADDVLTALVKETEAKGNGFVRMDNGNLAYECRCLKACLMEAINSCWPGVNWPSEMKKPDGLRKGLENYSKEALEVVGRFIDLGITEPDIVGEQRIKHINSPQGKKSIISVVDCINRPALTFQVRVRDDFIPQKVWYKIWAAAEIIGIGADRRRGDGRFDLKSWTKLS
jgi:hypothetical protein